MKRNNRLHWIAVISITFAASTLAADAQAGWPLGQPARGHLPSNYRGYTVAPTYSYMPRAYPYGNFGAQGYMPTVVYYDHHHNLRTWGPWPGF